MGVAEPRCAKSDYNYNYSPVGGSCERKRRQQAEEGAERHTTCGPPTAAAAAASSSSVGTPARIQRVGMRQRLQTDVPRVGI